MLSMVECAKCKYILGWFTKKYKYGGKTYCLQCYESIPDQEIQDSKNAKLRKHKEQKAIHLLRNAGISLNRKYNQVCIEYKKTELAELLPPKVKNRTVHSFAIPNTCTDSETGERINYFEKLLRNFIDSDYDVDKITNEVVEDVMRYFEIEKIKKRQRKREIKEDAEKTYFNKVKNKRLQINEEEKESILDKFNNECAICGQSEGLHIHHKDKNPNNNKISNLIVLCGVCHKKIHMKVR